MKVKFFQGRLGVVETSINVWLEDSGVTMIDAKLVCGHHSTYVVLVRYEEYVGPGTSNNTTFVNHF